MDTSCIGCHIDFSGPCHVTTVLVKYWLKNYVTPIPRSTKPHTKQTAPQDLLLLCAQWQHIDGCNS